MRRTPRPASGRHWPLLLLLFVLGLPTPAAVAEEPPLPGLRFEMGTSYTLPYFPGLRIPFEAYLGNEGSVETASATAVLVVSPDEILSSEDLELRRKTFPPVQPGSEWYWGLSEIAPAPAGTWWFAVCLETGPGLVGWETCEALPVEVVPAPVASLHVVEVKAAWSPYPGDAFEARARVRNGDVRTAVSAPVRVYLSADDTLDAGDPEIASAEPSPSDPYISAGAYSTFTLVLPPFPAAGEYLVFACVDLGDGFPRAPERCAAGVVVVQTRPPLPTVEPVFASQTEIRAGVPITVNAVLRNHNAVPTLPTSLSFLLSADTAVTSYDPLLAEVEVPALGPGETLQVQRQVLPIPGETWNLAACEGRVYRKALRNRCTVSAEQVRVVTADLKAGSLTLTPRFYAPVGETVSVQLVVANVGDAVAESPEVAFFLADWLSFPDTSPEIYRSPVAPLAPGEERTEVFQIPAPPAPGMYFLAPCLEGAPDDLDRDNNCHSRGKPFAASSVIETCPSRTVAGFAIWDDAVIGSCQDVELGPNVEIEEGADVVVEAGTRVSLGNGFRVASGARFTARSCGHDLCTPGPKLDHGCHSCVDVVCWWWYACCEEEWTDFCVELVNRHCGGVCPAD